MPFPNTPREIYQNNPLEEVICQLRFPTILSITSTPPVAFQEAIRADYPWFAQQTVPEIPDVPAEFRDMMQGFAGAQTPPSFAFDTENRGRKITLAQDSLAVSEREYRQWGYFRQEIQRAESLLREIYNPTFYTRIGLRYRDVLDRRQYGLENERWSALLNPSFIGLLGDEHVSEEVRESQTRVVLAIPDVDGGQVLLQQGLVIKEGDDLPVYVIDADFSTQHRCDPNDAFYAADKFNKWAGDLFRWAISSTLREKLAPFNRG